MYSLNEDVNESVQRYKKRRLNRILRRNDAERLPENKIKWVTINKTKVPIDESGEVVGPVGEDRGGELKLKDAKSLPIPKLRKSEYKEKKVNKSRKTARRGMTQEVLKCKDFDSLKELMRDKYGIKRIHRRKVPDLLKKENFEALKGILSTATAIMEAFPGIGEEIDSIEDVDWSELDDPKPIAQIKQHITEGTIFGDKGGTYDCRFQLSPACGSVTSAKLLYGKEGHPQNTTWEDVGSHELGHVIEIMLFKKHIREGRVRDSYHRYWDNGDNVWDIIVGAARDVLGDQTITQNDSRKLRESISRYALKNLHETFAEAICDYNRNGKNANPLSIAIWNRARKELYGS